MVKVLIGFAAGFAVCAFLFTHTAEVKGYAKSAVNSSAGAATKAVEQGKQAANKQLSK